MNRFTKDYFITAAIRAFHTFWQAMASLLVVGATITEIDWRNVLSVSIVAAIISIAKSFAVGMPETSMDGEFIVDTSAEEKDVYTLNFDADPAVLADKKTVLLKVVEKATVGGKFTNGCRNGVTGIK